MLSLNVKTIALMLLLLFLASNFAFAEGLRCKKSGEVRLIEVVRLKPDSALPCEVQYHKYFLNESNKRHISSEKLWEATYEVGYCERKAAKLARRLQSHDWECKRNKISDENHLDSQVNI